MLGPVFAQEPSIDRIYTLAQSNLAEAQAMVAGILRTHPNSAKAHFMNAELLARQGKIADADVELRAAEKLEPGLPFTSSEAAQDLQRRIASPRAAAPAVAPSGIVPYGNGVAHRDSGSIPWLTMLLVAAVGLVVYFVFQSMGRRSAIYQPARSSNGTAGPAPQGPGYTPQAPTGSMRSGILGGLATGVAVGAGVVAGEALAHRFTQDHHDTTSSGVAADTSPAIDSMGGNDFGIADSSSWDDNLGGGGGGHDWS